MDVTEAPAKSQVSDRLGAHPQLRSVDHGVHVRMCRSCYRENAAWVLKDQNGGYPKCPFSNDRWEPLPDVVGKDWKAKYGRMVETVGYSSLPKKRMEAAATTGMWGSVADPEEASATA